MAGVKVNVVFMGSPEFSVPSLLELNKFFDVVGVITQPDRPSGRGKKLTPPPVKILADQLKLPVIQPQKLKEPETISQLEKWSPDVIIVAAYNQILRKEVLELPPFGCFNIHASLLPRWRGAAPIQAAILHGDKETGITIMKMDAGLDTGPIVSQEKIPIHEYDTAESLSHKLAEVGSKLVTKTLQAYIQEEITLSNQDDQFATYAPMLKKEDGVLDFTKPAAKLTNQIRAFFPWPGSFTYWQGKLLKVIRAYAIIPGDEEPIKEPGTHIEYENYPAIWTTSGLLVLEELQLAGKNAVLGDAFLHGIHDWSQ